MPEPTRNNNLPFVITEIDRKDEVVAVEIHKGVLGPLANQLRSCPKARKAAGIIRKLGFELGTAGNILYGSATEEELESHKDLISGVPADSATSTSDVAG